jgi:hypothetical protein
MAAASASIRFSPDAVEWTCLWNEAVGHPPRRLDSAGTLIGGAAAEAGGEPGSPPLESIIDAPTPLPADRWSSTNLGSPWTPADLRWGEAVAIAAGDGRCELFGSAGSDGVMRVEGLPDARISAVWSWLLAEYGSLPWDHVDVVAVEGLRPLGVSFPAVVCIDATTLRLSLTGRFLYLVHELVHQWFGNLLRFETEDARWEAWIDALARRATRTALSPAVDPVFERLNQRYRDSGVPELVERGRRAAAYHRILMDDADTAAEWSRLSAAGAASIRRHGRRLTVDPFSAPAISALLKL